MDDDEGSSIYLYSEAGTENQDAKVAEREAEEETDKSYYMNKDGKQILKYPKIKISIRLSLPVPIVGFVNVSTIVKGEVINVGKTETCQKTNSPDFSKTPKTFTYFAGVDNHQRVLLEIFDGDNLSIGAGYLLESKELYVVDLLRPNASFPIVIENDNWGTIYVETEYSLLDYVEEIVDVEKVTAKELAFAFFDENPPSEDHLTNSIKKLDKTRRDKVLKHEDKFYVLNFVFDSFNPFKKEKLIDLNLPELQIIVKAVPLGKRIGDEVILWESPWLSGPPYALNIHALEKTKDELVGGPPSVVKKEDYKYRYLHILVHGCNNNVQAGKPKADPKVLCEVRFCVEKIFEGTAQRSGVLGTLGKARKFKWRHHFQAADALTKIRRQEEELKKSSKKSSTDSDNGSSVQAGSRSFFAAGPKTLTEADLEDACNVSLCADSDEGATSDEEETHKINRSQSVIFGAAVAAPASGGGLFSRLAKAASKSSTPVDKFQIIGSSKDKCGMVQCKFFYNTKPVILAEGDDLYQARIALLTRKEGDKWKRNIASLFADECKLQALMTSKFIRTLEGLRRGWKYETFVVVDLHGECLRSTYDSLSKIEGEEGLRRDDDFILRCPVWRVLSEVYQNFAYFEENSSMRVFAGGGLLSPIPPKKVEGDAVFGDYEEGGHPSHGFGRESAFPLSQEVIQAEGGFFDAIGISSISRDENLHSFMQRSKFDSWGGWDYCRSKRFGGIDQLLDAFCESISIYCPSVVEDDVAALQKRRNDFQNDAQSMLNMRFKSLSAIMEGEKVLEDGNTLHMLEKFPEEFYSKVPLNFDASLIERLIDDLPAPNTIQFGVWIINKIPNEIEINNISRVCKRYSEEVVIDPKKSQNGAAQQALLLVLCPDEQIDYLDPSPFKELLLAIGTATGLSINDDNKSIVKLELPRLRIIVRVTWTMLLSRICSTSVLETPMKQSPADAVAAPSASPSMFSLSKATPAPTQPPSRSNKSDTSVSFVKTEYYDYFGNEVNKLLGVHKKTAAAIVDKTLLEGAHHEVIQSLRLLQRSFEYEIDSLCRRCFEDFIIDTCDEVLLPYGFGEEGDDLTRLRRSSSSPAKLTRKDVATTPAKAQDCTAADCSMS